MIEDVLFKGNRVTLNTALMTVEVGDTFVIGEYLENVIKFIDQELSKRALRAMYYGTYCTVCVIANTWQVADHHKDF